MLEQKSFYKLLLISFLFVLEAAQLSAWLTLGEDVGECSRPTFSRSDTLVVRISAISKYHGLCIAFLAYWLGT
jgi:hypothetical protein